MTWRRVAPVLLLFLALPLHSAQDDDLAPVYGDEEHEFKFRPPAGWTKRPGATPTVVKFFSTEKLDPVPEIVVIHYRSQNPTPLETFHSGLKEYLAQHHAGHEILWDKERTIAGRPARQIAFKWTSKSGAANAIIKTAIWRNHHEYYVVDFQCPPADSDRLFKLFEKSLATFAIESPPLDADDRAALERGTELLKAYGVVSKDLLNESWCNIYVSTRKIGYQRMKLSESSMEGKKGYALETDVVIEAEGIDRLTIRGFCSADFTLQKIAVEEKITPEKSQEITFTSTVTLKGGVLQSTRNMNGVKEEKSLKVGEGVLLTDAMDILRRAMVDRPKGTYLFRTLTAFTDEPGTELVEIGGKEKVNPKTNVEKEVYVVFSKVDRRKTYTYWYAGDRTLYGIQGGKDPIVLLGCTKEEAEKK